MPARPVSSASINHEATGVIEQKLDEHRPHGGFLARRRRLPHWTLDGATYFLTWRLGAGQQPMSPGERSAVLEALRHFDAERYDLVAFVVMDDHVHVVVRPYEGRTLSSLAHSWKSYTANRMQRESGRVGAIWQSETFDRIIRDEREYFDTIKYILSNPRRRWPGAERYEWAGTAGGRERLHHGRGKS